MDTSVINPLSTNSSAIPSQEKLERLENLVGGIHSKHLNENREFLKKQVKF